MKLIILLCVLLLARVASAQPRVYVTNERSNDVSVIDTLNDSVVSTIDVGKRPRGVRVRADGKLLYVALSGSPIGGPNVRDEDLPPADKKADGGIDFWVIKLGGGVDKTNTQTVSVTLEPTGPGTVALTE